jgi:hypothetical protein
MEGVYIVNNLTFILTPERVLVKTNLQTFYLRPTTQKYKKRMAMIRLMIELNEIRNLEELASWCGTGIHWENYRRV